jgi:broad specificity phosphatase PhoE
MANEMIGRLILFRHGQTDYNDSEFDLTPEGVATIQSTALYLLNMLRGYSINLRYSPKPRTKTSAFVFCDGISLDAGSSQEDRHISSVGIRDHKKAMALFQEHALNGGIAAVDFSYLHDKRFDDLEICEPRDMVRNRFYWYLGRAIRQLFIDHKNTNEKPLCNVYITHYELLCHFVLDVFGIGHIKGETLKHGEVIDISVFSTDKPNAASLEVRFKGEQKTVLFEEFQTQEQ